LPDAASRIGRVEGLVARHDSMRVATEIAWRPSRQVTRWVFADRDGSNQGLVRRRVELEAGAREHGQAPARGLVVEQAPARPKVAVPTG